MDLDVALVNGLVVDGTGAPPVRSDCGVVGGRIAMVGDLSDAFASNTVDVAELMVAPGFVDVHTHSDLAAFLEPDHDNIRLGSVRQGVTTEVSGNCGFSPFPAIPGAENTVAEYLKGIFGPPTRVFPTLDEMASAVEEAGLVINLAPLVGHNTLRAAVVGSEDRLATDVELEVMAGLLDQALARGAIGMSTGLAYTPGNYAPSAEVAHLARVVAAHGRIYATHVRNETDEVSGAIDEALEVAAETGVRLHLSHLKAAGRRNWGCMPEILEKLNDARRRGVDVTADMYPYPAGSTLLHTLLPVWINAGGVDALLSRLQDDEARREVVRQIDEGIPGWQNFVGAIGWDNVVVAGAAAHTSYEGRTIAELASAAGTSDIDFVSDLLIAERATVMIIIRAMSEDDVESALSWDHTMVGSDGVPVPGKPHPRIAGSFARVLGSHRGRQDDLMEAIRKMTSMPADRFGLRDRGRIEEGAVADIVVFDPLMAADRATYEEPLLPPKGIHHVLVDGVVVVADGNPTGATPGQVVRAG
jgi:N-acyl-D-amino-acid deacylase